MCRARSSSRQRQQRAAKRELRAMSGDPIGGSAWRTLSGPRKIAAAWLAPQTLVLDYADLADFADPADDCTSGGHPRTMPALIAERADFFGERPHRPGINSGAPCSFGGRSHHASIDSRARWFFGELPRHPRRHYEQQAVAVPQKTRTKETSERNGTVDPRNRRNPPKSA